MRQRSAGQGWARASVAVAALTVGAGVVPGVSQAATPSSASSPTVAATYDLSLGDSYAIGYQPGIGGTPGYTHYVARHLGLSPLNFGCGGATSSSILSSIGCGDPASEHAVAYPDTTQEQAALNFIAAHHGAVRLVTISIGGNDFDSCTTAACVSGAMPTMEANIKSLVASLDTALTAASDTGARIIGLTYPDVELGFYVFPVDPPTTAQLSQAKLSITAFDDLINPTLRQSYRSVARGSFVDVTDAPYQRAVDGDDTPLSVTQQFAPYGTVPVAVAEVCHLTYFCTEGNIHATTPGYDFIGRLIVAQYRSLTSSGRASSAH